VSIWASWILAVRLGIRTSLTPWDIVAIRSIVAGLILLPYLLKKGLAIDRLGGVELAAILLGGGAPMVLASYGGLLFAPAAHAAPRSPRGGPDAEQSPKYASRYHRCVLICAIRAVQFGRVQCAKGTR
jgi:hypothetical protein